MFELYNKCYGIANSTFKKKAPDIKVFISGPITGIDNYKENFQKAKEELIALGCKEENITSPGDLQDEFKENNAGICEMMLKEATMLKNCKAVYFTNGFNQSFDCIFELATALQVDNMIFISKNASGDMVFHTVRQLNLYDHSLITSK